MRRFECSAILFDLDGVLVDSAAWIELQWRRWAVRRGLDPAPFHSSLGEAGERLVLAEERYVVFAPAR